MPHSDPDKTHDAASPDKNPIPPFSEDGTGAVVPPKKQPLLREIPGYKISREVAQGGQGIVYDAIHETTGRRVALKLLFPTASNSRDQVRFDREVQILAALRHPNIIDIIDRGELTDGSFYLAMPYISGRPFDAWMAMHRDRIADKSVGSDVNEALTVMLKVCDAVNAAHLRGVVHRDLKPSNIVVDEDSEPHILDFGLAKTAFDSTGVGPMTMTGQFLGSLPWASPEQADGQVTSVDVRSDVYSLGVILYQVLTGEFPYAVVGTVRDILNNIVTAKPVPPSSILPTPGPDANSKLVKSSPKSVLSKTIDGIVLKALAKKREDRYQNAGELAQEIERYLAGRPATASSTVDGVISGPKQVTIFYSAIFGSADLASAIGDREASTLFNRVLEIQDEIIKRAAGGRVVNFVGDCVFAVFDSPSLAMSRALEIQQAFHQWRTSSPTGVVPAIRIGLHMGEVLLEQGDRLELVGRHTNRARCVMEIAGANQIIVSRTVIETGRDFIEGVSPDHLGVRHYGEFVLKGVGPTELCEVCDLRIKQPEMPILLRDRRPENAHLGRLELAGYREIRRVGEGAFGVVYRAVTEGDHVVAIKVLAPSLVENVDARKRFEMEVTRLRSLAIPGLVRLIGERLDHSPPFFVTEYVEGKPINEALVDASAERIATVFRRLALAVGRAHAEKIVHGDLKPSNVLIRSDDQPVVLDLGMAMLVSVGENTASNGSTTAIMGTPAYLAPEQIRGAPASQATDIYALGIILYRILVGREPFHGDSIHQITQGHLHEEPSLPVLLKPQVSEALQRICLKSIEKAPSDRYLNIENMVADFDRFLSRDLVRTRPTYYDNAVYHRAQQHIERVREWARLGLVTREEANRLMSAYDPLLHRGTPAAMEGRHHRFWQTLVFVGGWAFVNGASIWLFDQWDALTRMPRLFLGSIPAFMAAAMAATMWRYERLRLVFVALVVAVLAVPLLASVWIHQFEIQHYQLFPENYELFSEGETSSPLNNGQMALIALTAFAVSLIVMVSTSTVTHSAQCAIFATILYVSFALLLGIKKWTMGGHPQWANVAVAGLPLVACSIAVVWVLIRKARREAQATPWIFLASALIIAIFETWPRWVMDNWVGPNTNARLWLFWSECLTVACGIAIVLAGLIARHWLRHRGRLATFIVMAVGLITILVATGRMGLEWPKDWWTLSVFGKQVPFPHLILPILSLIIAVIAVWVQLNLFLYIGLGGFAASSYFLEAGYFHGQSDWPRFVMISGFVFFVISLVVEMRRTKGNALDDMVSRTRL